MIVYSFYIRTNQEFLIVLNMITCYHRARRHKQLGDTLYSERSHLDFGKRSQLQPET